MTTCHSWPSLAWLYWAVSFAREKAMMKWRRPHSCRMYSAARAVRRSPSEPYLAASSAGDRPSSGDGGVLTATAPSCVVSLTLKLSSSHAQLVRAQAGGQIRVRR